MKLRKRVVGLAALALAVTMSLFVASALGGGAKRAAGPTYTVCIDIPFHPLANGALI